LIGLNLAKTNHVIKLNPTESVKQKTQKITLCNIHGERHRSTFLFKIKSWWN